MTPYRRQTENVYNKNTRGDNKIMSKKKNMSQVPRIMVFRPTWEEFSNFSKYIEHMESKGAHLAGVVKVNIQTIPFICQIKKKKIESIHL